MILTPYIDVRILMRPGDILAFGGKSRFSRLIKMATGSEVSHIAVVIKARAAGENLNWLAESSTGGVKHRRISQAVSTYDGDVWWLPLSVEARGRFDAVKFEAFADEHLGKPYDDFQCLLEPLNVNSEDFDKFYCSEFGAGSHKASGVLTDDINASRVNPKEMCSFGIYSGVQQLAGNPRSITSFNSVSLRR